MDIRSEVFKQDSFLFRRTLIDPPETVIQVRNILYPKLSKKLGIVDQKKLVIERYKKNLDLILMNLFLANRKELPLRYGRSIQFFLRDHCGETNRQFISKIRMLEIFDFLESEELITQFIGFRRRGNHKQGKLTTVIIHDSMKKLLSKIEMYTVFKSDKRIRNPVVVRTKNKEFNSKYDFTYSHTLKKFWMIKDKIKFLKNELDHLNKLYDKSQITVSIPIDILDERLINKLEKILTEFTSIKIRELRIKSSRNNNNNRIEEIKRILIDNTNNKTIDKELIIKQQVVIGKKSAVSGCNYWKKMGGVTQIDLDIREKHVRRIWKDNFKQGGRFYGPIYQRMNEKFRECILIDGEETIELDYGAMHFRILYHAVGIDYKDDPFQMPSKLSRFFVKKLGYIMMNCKNRKCAIMAIVSNFGKEGVSITYVTAKDILDKFCKRHEPISRFFYNSKWTILHRVESDIVFDILCELKNKGVIGLPVHDSIIIKKKHEELLYSLMLEKYKDIFKFDPIIS